MDLNENTLDNQHNPVNNKEDKPSSPIYFKPYISVQKHGENGKLFEDPFYDDRYIKNKGRNYH